MTSPFVDRVLTVVVVSILIALVLFLGSSALAQADDRMTNADVVKMLSAGLPPETIVLAIRTSKPAFDTSADALIALKRLGASESMLEAILTSANNTSQPATSSKDGGGRSRLDDASAVKPDSISASPPVAFDGREGVPSATEKSVLSFRVTKLGSFGKLNMHDGELKVGNGRVEWLPDDGQGKFSALASDLRDVKRPFGNTTFELKLKDGSKYRFLSLEKGIHSGDLVEVINEEAGSKPSHK